MNNHNLKTKFSSFNKENIKNNISRVGSKTLFIFKKRPLVFVYAFVIVGLASILYSLAYSVPTKSIPVSLTNCSAASSVRCFAGATASNNAIAFNGSGSTPVVNSGFGPAYDANLAMLKNSPFRNKLEDGSPYLSTPSASLPLDTLAPMTQAARDEYAANGEQPFLDTSGNIGAFRVECEFSHFGYDDPIKFPGQPGAAHLHVFFGNTHTNAYSNYNTLINSGGGTCNGHELNRTAYWIPAVIDGKSKVRVPKKAMIYYKSFADSYGKVEPYPENLKIISDNNINKTLSGAASFGDSIATYGCVNDYNGNKYGYSDTMPTCTGTVNTDGDAQVMEVNVKFNQCWNGVIDPVDDTKNMSYTLYNWYGATCPSTHPHVFANLEYRIFYRVQAGENTSSWFLSSDVDKASGTVTRGQSAHADWFGGWNKTVNKAWVDNCNNWNPPKTIDCATGWLGGLTNQGNQFRSLKIRNYYWKTQGRVAAVDGKQLFTAVCPGVTKTIAKPADLAYCK